MALLIKGINKLSELIIDADKDFAADTGTPKSITNIKQVAASMAIGNIVQSDGTKLVRIPNGPDGYVLTSQGAGKLLTWAPPGGALKYYLPVSIGLSFQTQKRSLDHSSQVSPSFTTRNLEAIADDPTDNIRFKLPNLAIAQQTAKRALDHDSGVNPALGSQIYILVDGAISETAAGAQTDETVAARSATANDLNLPPMTPALGDKYYFGFRFPFRGIWLQQGTNGVGNWATTWYYWNGAWNVLSEQDYTAQFQSTGFHRVWWGTKPVDWVTSTIDGLTWYWVKVQTTSYVNQTTKPLGSQAWCIL